MIYDCEWFHTHSVSCSHGWSDYLEPDTPSLESSMKKRVLVGNDLMWSYTLTLIVSDHCHVSSYIRALTSPLRWVGESLQPRKLLIVFQPPANFRCKGANELNPFRLEVENYGHHLTLVDGHKVTLLIDYSETLEFKAWALNNENVASSEPLIIGFTGDPLRTN